MNPAATQPAALERGLGLSAAFALVAGGIIGVSIFLIPGAVAKAAGSSNLALAAWLVAGVLSGCAALCFAELGASIPETGGLYVYLKRAYRSEAIAFSYAWMICFAYGSGAIAVVAIMAATYLIPLLLPGGGGPNGAPIAACCLILTVLVLNLSGIRHSGKVQVALTVFKVLLLLAVAITPFMRIHFDPNWLSQPVHAPAGLVAKASDFVDALLLCLFSFSGASFVTQVAGEVRDPARNVSKAIILGFGAVFVLYLAVNVSYFSALPFGEIIKSDKVASDIMGLAFGRPGTLAISVGIGISALAVLNAQMMAYPRVVFALARSGFLQRYLGTVEGTGHVPAGAITLVALWSAVLSLTGTYQAILATMAFVSHLFTTLIVFAVIILRRREPSLPRPFRVPGYPFTPLAFVAVSIIYLSILVYQRPTQVVLGLGIVASGLPVFAMTRRVRATRPRRN
jgi:APA family basic amino acid/polyamine antiporter